MEGNVLGDGKERREEERGRGRREGVEGGEDFRGGGREEGRGRE